jgi:hypothetical protein
MTRGADWQSAVSPVGKRQLLATKALLITNKALLLPPLGNVALAFAGGLRHLLAHEQR